MLDVVRLLTGGIGLAGLVYLARQLPPLLTQYQLHQTRVGGAKRYSEWRGAPGAGPDVLDRLEGELIVSRLKRLAGVGIASIVAIALAIFPPLQ
jgi:hypothetical protein